MEGAHQVATRRPHRRALDLCIAARRYSVLKAALVSLAIASLLQAGHAQCEVTKLLPQNGLVNQFQEFGSAVALWDRTALIGAPGRGAVYVFSEQPSGQWLEVLTLEPDLGNSNFGESLDLQGIWAVVGAPTFDDGPNQVSAGIAITYRFNGSSWIEHQRLTVPVTEAFARLGTSAAISGGKIVVGAPGATGTSTSSGAAYVFELAPALGRWLLVAKLAPSDGSAGDWAGGAVAVFDDTVVVGAGLKASGSMPFAGAAYVFEKKGGTWIETAKLVGGGEAGESFGDRAVAVDEHTIFVGASRNSGATGLLGAGAVFIFERSHQGWDLVQEITAADSESDESFGSSVAVHSGTLIVGSVRDQWSKNGGIDH